MKNINIGTIEVVQWKVKRDEVMNHPVLAIMDYPAIKSDECWGLSYLNWI